MKVTFASLLSVCLLSLVSAGAIWDEYLDDGIPAAPVKLDQQERKPLVLVEPSKSDCYRISIAETIRQYEMDSEFNVEGTGNEQSPRELLRAKTVSFCQQKLEKEATENLAKLDSGTKERVNSLVENIIKANGGRGFDAKFHMPQGAILGGILTTIEQSDTDLSSIKTFDEFQQKYDPLLDDCKSVYKALNDVMYSYNEFLNKKRIQPEPTVAQWVRNTNVCSFLAARGAPHARDAYQLLENKNESTQKESHEAPIKSGKRFNILRVFSAKH